MIQSGPAPRKAPASKTAQLDIEVSLQYDLPQAADILLQIEAAPLPEQQLLDAHISVTPTDHFARVPGEDYIGERIWLRAQGTVSVEYRSRVGVQRLTADCASLPATPPHLLPGETVAYMLPSRFCPSDNFLTLVEQEFSDTCAGARVMAIHDWIAAHIAYCPGSSNAATGAMDTFIERQGVCRDFAHLMISMVRASAIPARFVSVYAPNVEPPDFHAVAEVFLDGTWYLLDPTGMADAAEMAKIGVGRDAADVAFLTCYGTAALTRQDVSVRLAG